MDIFQLHLHNSHSSFISLLWLHSSFSDQKTTSQTWQKEIPSNWRHSFQPATQLPQLYHYMTDLAIKHKTYRLISPFRSEIYTSEPANVEYILKTNFDNYGRGSYHYSNLKDLLGDGIFTVDGDKWQEQRKLSRHEFSTKVLRNFISVVFRENVAKLAQILSEAASSNKTVDIQDLFMKSTLDSIFRAAFGVDLDSMCGSNEEGKNFSDAVDNASENDTMEIC